MEKVLFYAQISETGGGTYFFYNTLEDEQSYKYSLEIPYEYEIDKEYYKLKDRNLFELSDKLRKVLKIINKNFGTLLHYLLIAMES